MKPPLDLPGLGAGICPCIIRTVTIGLKDEVLPHEPLPQNNPEIAAGTQHDRLLIQELTE